MLRKRLLSVAVIQCLLALLLGCSTSSPTSTPSGSLPTTTTPPSTSVPTQPSTPPSSSNTTMPPGPIIDSWGWKGQTDMSLKGGQTVFFPEAGARAESGRTLTVNWAADGTLGIFLLTSDQYHKFSAGQGIPESAAQGRGSSGSVNYYVANTDTFYVIIRNLYTTAAVVVYQAEMTER